VWFCHEGRKHLVGNGKGNVLGLGKLEEKGFQYPFDQIRVGTSTHWKKSADSARRGNSRSNHKMAVEAVRSRDYRPEQGENKILNLGKLD